MNRKEEKKKKKVKEWELSINSLTNAFEEYNQERPTDCLDKPKQNTSPHEGKLHFTP